MLPWMSAHPWMTFFIALGLIDAISAILAPKCPQCTGTTPVQTSGALGLPLPFIGRLPSLAVPHGNGVYHGLVRA